MNLILFFLGFIVFFLIATNCLPNENLPRTMVMIHGSFSNPSSFDTLRLFIKTDFPDRETIAIDAYNDRDSGEALQRQVPVFTEKVRKVIQEKGKIDLLGYSQGGVIAKGVIHELNNESQIHTFYALSPPYNGVYGGSRADEMYLTCYNSLGQEMAMCNFWRDPDESHHYLTENTFLPIQLNQIPHKKSQQYKQNFANLARVIMIGGPDDGVVDPWQSSQFGFYDKDLNVVEMKDTREYREDLYGLQSLAKRGALHPCILPNVEHIYWGSNHTVYRKCFKHYMEQD